MLNFTGFSGIVPTNMPNVPAECGVDESDWLVILNNGSRLELLGFTSQESAEDLKQELEEDAEHQEQNYVCEAMPTQNFRSLLVEQVGDEQKARQFYRNFVALDAANYNPLVKGFEFVQMQYMAALICRAWSPADQYLKNPPEGCVYRETESGVILLRGREIAYVLGHLHETSSMPLALDGQLACLVLLHVPDQVISNYLSRHYQNLMGLIRVPLLRVQWIPYGVNPVLIGNSSQDERLTEGTMLKMPSVNW